MYAVRPGCIRRFSAPKLLVRRFSSARKYDPNVVNVCLDPPPGKRLPVVPLFFALGCFLLGTPLIVMHYDNKRFLAELERRKDPEVRY